jgi:hypothetical protein
LYLLTFTFQNVKLVAAGMIVESFRLIAKLYDSKRLLWNV